MSRRTNRSRVFKASSYVAEALESRMLLTAYAWNNASGGNWNTAANWTPNGIPAVGDDVTIAMNGSYTVTLSGTAASIHSLSLGGATGTQSLTVSTDLTLATESTLAANSILNFNSGTIRCGGLGGDIKGYGTINWTGGTMAGSSKVIVESGGRSMYRILLI